MLGPLLSLVSSGGGLSPQVPRLAMRPSYLVPCQTSRHDGRLWRRHILDLFPGATGHTSSTLRNQIRVDLETIRALRNRIAHHEPIFTRDLAEDLRTMLNLIQLRSPETADLAYMLEDVTPILQQRP